MLFRSGIGTTTPGYKFHAYAASGTVAFFQTPGGGNVMFNNGVLDSNSSQFGLQAGSGNKAYIGANAGQHLTIDTTGYVGINTTTPTFKLDIQGDSDTNSFRVYSSNGTYGPAVRIQSTATNGRAWNLISNSAGNAGGAGALQFWNTTDSVTAMVILPTGYVGIGTSTPGYKLEVNGSFAATTKSFVIPHPTKPGKKLRYGSLEGPENGVYVRGKLKGTNTIELPEYWTKLIDPESITVNLTPIGKHQKLYVADISDNKVTVEIDGFFGGEISCFYTVFAERIDVEKLQVEVDAK